MKPSKFLTSRSTVITLFIAIGAALLFASAVPQRTTLGMTPPWVERLPGTFRSVVTLLGLDNIVGSNWFALLVALFWVSLAVSALSQFQAARSLVYRLPPLPAPQEGVRLRVSPALFAGLAQGAGYRPAGSVAGACRYVKHRSGYWGNFLLHLGIVTAVLFSLVYVLTQHRVMVRLTSEEITRFSSGSIQEMRGILAQRQPLPYSVALKSLSPRFWWNDRLESLASELYFTGQPGGEPARVDVALSDKSQFGPYLVYQVNTFGRAFDLELTASGETHRERLYLPYPMQRDRAGYGELPLAGTGFLLKGKFYADRERRSMQLHDPPFALRLYRGTELLGEASLTPGATKQLGPFGVRLVQSQWWTDILLDGTRGTAGIFTGFALILAGVLSSYCLVPREIMVWEMDDGICVQHQVRRFARFYGEEFEEIIMKVADRNALPPGGGG